MQVDKSLEPALEDDILLLTGAGSVEVCILYICRGLYIVYCICIYIFIYVRMCMYIVQLACY